MKIVKIIVQARKNHKLEKRPLIIMKEQGMEGLDRKAMLGPKIRRFRTDLGMSQTEMAGEIGISPSYLNLIEHNQRPVTVPLLFKLGQAFELDLKQFAEDDDAKCEDDDDDDDDNGHDEVDGHDELDDDGVDDDDGFVHDHSDAPRPPRQRACRRRGCFWCRALCWH